MLDDKTTEILDLAKSTLKKKLQFPPTGSFGKGLSERCIETPWVASHFRGGELILDVGFTMSSLDYMGLLLELKNQYGVSIEPIDIVRPERVASRYPEEWRSEILSIPVSIGDLRTTELPANRYDFVTCISTIEHIGFDVASQVSTRTAFERALNRQDVQMKRDLMVHERVLGNFNRTLKSGGSLLISVPMGKGGPVLLQDSLGYFCAQWEYEEISWREITSAPGFELAEELFFVRNPDQTWERVQSPRDLHDQNSELKPHAEGCALARLRKQ